MLRDYVSVDLGDAQESSLLLNILKVFIPKWLKNHT